MAVSEEYRQRLKAWVGEEVKRHNGLNAFSRHTERVLSRYNLDGFPSAMLGRWRKGEVKEELADTTLARIGILKGFGKDPSEAQHVAYNWLHGLSQEAPSATDSAVAHPLLEQVRTAPLSGSILQAIAIAAVERLGLLAQGEGSGVQTQEEEIMPAPTPLSYLLDGWLKKHEAEPSDLAAELNLPVERLTAALDGYPLTKSECEVIAPFFDMQVEALSAWGVCELPQAD